VGRAVIPTRPGVEPGGRSASPPTDRVIAVLGLLAASPGREFTLADVIRETGIS